MAHQKRNLAEYEGHLKIEKSQITKLCALVTELIKDVENVVSASLYRCRQ
jgi:hypothetical protein